MTKATHHTDPIEILLVEDSPGDVRLTEEGLREAKVHNRLHVAVDGVEAMSFLRKEGEFSGAPTPDIILLDLNMPRKDGREVLEEVKGDKRLKSIPIIILTTSDAGADIVTSYDLHANCYVTKPVEFEDFVKVIKRIEQFWLQEVRLPGSALAQR